MAPDGHGGQLVTGWSLLGEAWCAVRTLSSRERLAAMRLEVLATHEITAPWCEELSIVTTSDRAQMAGRLLNIVSVINNDEANDDLLLLAEEGVPT